MKKTLNTLIALFISFNLFALSGNGSAETPYLLGNSKDLLQLATDINGSGVNNYIGKYYELTKNIDLSSIKNWKPIGIDITHPFQGILDGKGYTITGLLIAGDFDNRGFFGFIKGAEIKNLKIEGSVSGSNNIAAIAAYAINSKITNCLSAATVTASEDNAGAIVGVRYKTEVLNCINKGIVKAASGIGGDIGLTYTPEEAYNVHSTNLNGIISVKPKYEKLAYHYIPSKIGSSHIARLYDNFLKENIYVQEVEIVSANFTNLHPSVLHSCPNLKKVTITSTKNVGIGHECFYDCTALKGVFIIPDCVNAIGNAVLTGCTGIQELHISPNVKSIGRAFLGMTNLHKLYLPGTSVVNLTSADSFSRLRYDAKIYVPAELVDSYKIAPNWSNFSSIIVAIP